MFAPTILDVVRLMFTDFRECYTKYFCATCVATKLQKQVARKTAQYGRIFVGDAVA